MRVYKISSPHTEKIYIGKTKQKYLSTRFAVHRYHYKLFKENRFSFISSYKVLQYGDCKIEPLIICDNLEELNKKEKELINLNSEICVNISK